MYNYIGPGRGRRTGVEEDGRTYLTRKWSGAEYVQESADSGDESTIAHRELGISVSGGCSTQATTNTTENQPKQGNLKTYV
jgi:ethanolamine ammonia-lyase small subunit